MLDAPELPTGGVLGVAAALALSVGELAPGVVVEEVESAVAGVLQDLVEEMLCQFELAMKRR